MQNINIQRIRNCLLELNSLNRKKYPRHQSHSKSNSLSKSPIHSSVRKKRNDSIGSNVSIGDNYIKGSALNSFPPKNMRYIALDTETTGLSSQREHLVSINAVEIINAQLTGIQYHSYINPRHKLNDPKENKGFTYYIEDYANERDDNAYESLKDFLRFVDDCPIISHNAKFDIKFINKELRRYNLKEIELNKCICTLAIANRRKGMHFYEQNECLRLGSLCQRYNIFIKQQDYHHGIVDAIALGRLVCKMWNEDERLINQEYMVHQFKNTFNDYNYNSGKKKEISNYQNVNSNPKKNQRRKKKYRVYNKFDEENIEENKKIENFEMNNFGNLYNFNMGEGNFQENEERKQHYQDKRKNEFKRQKSIKNNEEKKPIGKIRVEKENEDKRRRNSKRKEVMEKSKEKEKIKNISIIEGFKIFLHK